ncbi:restriction endonuclease subunit S [Maribacter flavus]|uniref:Restriction endonuclease subunit S n=1 Tax=Maribacter flavus TaxID=1658664 RepID=A0A5B2TMZ0_9FLAO|nr:restriction endonuclease subunit S [Maribacter flavus]KAA2215746.1 restriction endonuclease subunit S [Maribacter flavus]
MQKANIINSNEVVGERPGYKHTKLGWIPEEWKVISLKELAVIKRGRFSPRPRNDPKFYGGDYPFVQTGDVSNSSNYVRSHSQTLNEEGLKVSCLFEKGTILMTIAANIGHTGILAYDMACPDSLIGIVCGKSVDNQFLNYQFNYNQKRIEYLAPAGAQKNINIEFLAPFKIVTPPIEEQKSIAQCLLTWDTAITKLNKLIKTKQKRKKGLMQQLLTGEKRLPGFNGEWKEVSLSNIAKRVTRKNTELNDNVVTISAQKGFIKQEDFFNKRVASSTLLNYTLVNRGEYCYNKSYSNGYPMGAFKRLDDFDKAVVTTLYICFRLKENVYSNFMNQFFEAGRMIQGLMRIAQEGGRAHGLLNIGLSDFFGLKLQIPSHKEQTAIAQILNAADKEIQLLQEQLKQLELQKKGMMQQLLTGKRRLINN